MWRLFLFQYFQTWLSPLAFQIASLQCLASEELDWNFCFVMIQYCKRNIISRNGEMQYLKKPLTSQCQESRIAFLWWNVVKLNKHYAQCISQMSQTGNYCFSVENVRRLDSFRANKGEWIVLIYQILANARYLIILKWLHEFYDYFSHLRVEVW